MIKGPRRQCSVVEKGNVLCRCLFVLSFGQGSVHWGLKMGFEVLVMERARRLLLLKGLPLLRQAQIRCRPA